MTRLYAGLLSCALLVGTAAVRAQEVAPILHHTFDASDEGWAAHGVNARATVDHQHPLEGAGALRLDYDLQRNRFGLVTVQTPAGSLAGARSIRFSAFANSHTTLAVLVQTPGGTWMAPFTVNKGAWQRVEISTYDFVPITPAPSASPDARLSMEQATALSVGDAAVLIGLLGNDDVARLLGIGTGPRVLRIDSFSVTREALPGGYTARDGAVFADTFARPHLGWIALGGATLRRIVSRTPEERGLEARYEQAPQRLVAFMRPIPRGRLRGMSRLDMGISSATAGLIVVQLEEAGGGKFNSIVEMPQQGGHRALSLELATLTPADDSTVRDRPIDVERVTHLVVIDATGMLGRPTPAANTLTVTGLRFRPAE
ncbi:MAG TPA: hypothetical protein VLH79_02210 [Chthonomonadales bacterium]|nr:hypothetical protein [Chthonomonadales bacterium]